MMVQIFTFLAARFSPKDLGSLSYFLGVEVHPHPQDLFLSQWRYIMDILARTRMLDAKPVTIPLATAPPLTFHSGTALSD